MTSVLSCGSMSWSSRYHTVNIQLIYADLQTHPYNLQTHSYNLHEPGHHHRQRHHHRGQISGVCCSAFGAQWCLVLTRRRLVGRGLIRKGETRVPQIHFWTHFHFHKGKSAEIEERSGLEELSESPNHQSVRLLEAWLGGGIKHVPSLIFI